MTTTPTFCRLCEPGCGLVAETANDRLVSLRPDKAHPVHKGFACHKGLKFAEVHEDPDRLNEPQRKSDSGVFEDISWESAVSEIAEKLQEIAQEHGSHAIAAYQGNPSAYSTATYQHGTSLLKKLGCGRFFSAGTQDCSAKFAASEGMFGAMMVHPYPDLLHTHYFLSLGSNPKVSHMSFIHVSDPMQKLKDVRNRGGKVVFVNPREIESSNQSTGEVLKIRPDTDFYFLAAILNEIVFSLGYDEDWVDRHAKNADQLKEFVAPYTPEVAECVTNIGAEQIRKVAKEFVDAESASIHMSTGVNQGRQGAMCYLMTNMISLFSGNLGRRGGNIYSPNFFPMAKFSAYKGVEYLKDSGYEEVRKIGNDLPANLLPDLIQEENNPIRALIVVAGNPVLSLSGGSFLSSALDDLELLVVIDLYHNATCNHADYVLPATDWLEREDLNSLGASVGVALEPYVQYSPAILEPKANRRDDWWILSAIAKEMGMGTVLDQEFPRPLDSIERLLEHSDLSIERLKAMPSNTFVLDEPNPEDLFLVGLQHEDGKVDCFPNTLSAGAIQAALILEELRDEPEDQLKLISRRTNYMMNSWLHNMSSLKVKSQLTNPLFMNSSDAHARSLGEGDEVEVYNEHGVLEAEVKIDNSLAEGVIAMAHGWGNSSTEGMKVAQQFPGVNVNELAPVGFGSYDPLSNQSHMTGLNVNVRKTN